MTPTERIAFLAELDARDRAARHDQLLDRLEAATSLDDIQRHSLRVDLSVRPSDNRREAP